MRRVRAYYLQNHQIRMGEYSPEKAGVGGSIPSLATIIPKDLAHIRISPPVRSQSAIFRRDPVRFLATMTVKH